MNKDILDNKEELEAYWEGIDWEKAESKLESYEIELSKLAYMKRFGKISALQKKMTSDIDIKVLAVRHVANNMSMAGIDKVKWITAADKAKAALTLNEGTYHSSPCNNFFVYQNGKERMLSVPTAYDRAMQKLYAYALAPVVEASGDKKSFAFRKGRSAIDAHEYIKSMLNAKGFAGWVVITDIKSYYNTISHRWLMKNVPMDKAILKEFLKSGYVFNGELFPTKEGISLGFSVSPLVGNLTLDGLQAQIYKELYPNVPVKQIDHAHGNMLRFADDILVTAKSKESAEQILKIIEKFSAERGLKVSEPKTKICHISEGFEMLSRHYKKEGDALIVKPSKEAVAKLEQDLEEMILQHRGSQKSLIESINRKLTGWAVYHRVTDAYDAFRHIDVVVQAYLLKLCKKKHPNMPQKKILNKYWFTDANGDRVYALPDKIEFKVMTLAYTVSTEHKKVMLNKNPFLDKEYFEKRESDRSIRNVTGKYKSIWERQNGKCYYCGNRILPDQDRDVIVIDISKKATVKNCAYVHSLCKNGSLFDYARIKEQSNPSGVDITALLQTAPPKKSDKYGPLADYFRNRDKLFITLSFEEIEKILHDKLPKIAYERNAFWTRQGFGRISEAWMMQGYSIHSVQLQKKKIVLKRTEKNISGLNIPDVFLYGKIPLNAKYEIENFLEYIKKKYGI